MRKQRPREVRGISQEPMESVLTYSSLCLKPLISLNKGRSWVRRRARLGCRIRTICPSLFSYSLPPWAKPPTAQKPGGLPFTYEAPWGGCLQAPRAHSPGTTARKVYPSIPHDSSLPGAYETALLLSLGLGILSWEHWHLPSFHCHQTTC